MITFIIPTIYKSSFLIQLLRSLDVHPLVSEILLIEDCPSTGILNNCYFNKLNVVPFQERKYCNGGWNLGINLTKTHYYALCSDDILFPTTIIDDILYFYKSKPNSGVIGMHKTQFDTACKPNVYGFIKREVWHLEGGWGSLIFNHHNNDIIIPSELKQWCGDTYFLYYSKYPCYNYFGEKFNTNLQSHSTSTNNELINTVCVQDCKVFEEKYKLEKPIWA